MQNQKGVKINKNRLNEKKKISSYCISMASFDRIDSEEEVDLESGEEDKN